MPRPRRKPHYFHESLLPDVAPSQWSETSSTVAPSSRGEKRKKSSEIEVTRILGGPSCRQSSSLFKELAELTVRCLPLSLEHVQFVLEEPTTATFVMRKNRREVIGGMGLRRADSDLFQISFIAVDDNYRDRGLGTKLLLRAIAHARQYRVDAVAVYADRAAVDFFSARGFSPPQLAKRHLDALDEYTQSTLLVANVITRPTDILTTTSSKRTKKQRNGSSSETRLAESRAPPRQDDRSLLPPIEDDPFSRHEEMMVGIQQPQEEEEEEEDPSGVGIAEYVSK